MPDTNLRPLFRWSSPTWRLVFGALVGIAVYVATMPLVIDLRVLLAYDAALLTYLAILTRRISCADGETTRVLAELKDASNALILILAGMFSACSLAGVGLMLHRSKDDVPLMANVQLGLSLLAVFLSWLMLHAMFGIHYARLYYDRNTDGSIPAWNKGLEFPEDDLPDFWDFMYFSFTIAVCYQVSDVTIRSRHIRRVTLAHVLLSFLNVTMILGLVVEIVSTLASAAGRGP